MSLINEALKKAQRQRAQEEADASAPAPGGTKAVRRRPPRTAEATLLISAGALVLVVLSVVLTVFLLNDSEPEHEASRVAAKAPAASATVTAESPEASPVIVANIPDRAPGSAVAPSSAGAQPVGAESPIATAPAVPAELAPTSSAPANGVGQTAAVPGNSAVQTATAAGTSAGPTTPPSDAIAPEASRAAPDTVAAAPSESAPGDRPVPKAPAKPDERIHAYVDGLRVTGIRASGDDSRVLMNERVYRVNDIVERTLGVRLIKVGTDSLTFEDANGATYVKHF